MRLKVVVVAALLAAFVFAAGVHAAGTGSDLQPVEGFLVADRSSGGDGADREPISGWGLVWTLLGVFAGGMALNLTPCVYPLIPITVSYFGGRSAGDGNGPAGHIVGNALCYIVGLALMNSFLGVLAALTGGLLGAALQKPITLIFIAAVMVALAMSMFGFWELRIPAPIAAVAGRSYTGYFGSLFMGVSLGLVAAPCLGPFVLGLLTWVAAMGSAWFGFLVFFTLSIGMGVPLLVLAILSSRLPRLPRSGEWMEWVRKFMGWVLIGLAVYFVRPITPGSLSVIIPVGMAFFASLHLGWIDESGSESRAFRMVKKAVGIAGIGLAVVLAAGWMADESGVKWQSYSEVLLVEAKRQNKPVMIDFYADWCPPCRMMAATTFRDKDVAAFAERNFVSIKVDLTVSGNPVNEQLVRRYRIQGVPTVVFLNAEGKEVQDYRVEQYLPAGGFMQHLSELRRALGN